jgi:hypothetical protein
MTAASRVKVLVQPQVRLECGLDGGIVTIIVARSLAEPATLLVVDLEPNA